MENKTFVEEVEDVYNVEIVVVPYWYRTSVTILLGTLAFWGVLLNGFVLWCFALCPSVSISTLKHIIFQFQPYNVE